MFSIIIFTGLECWVFAVVARSRIRPKICFCQDRMLELFNDSLVNMQSKKQCNLMSTLRGQSFHPRDSDDSYLPIFVFNGYCILKHLLWWYSILTFWEIHQMNSSSLLWHQIQRFCVFMIQRFLLITFLGKLFTMILYSLRFPFDMTTIFEIFRCRIFQPKTSWGSSLFCFLI